MIKYIKYLFLVSALGLGFSICAKNLNGPDADIFREPVISIIIKIDNEQLMFTVDAKNLEIFLSHVLVWYLDSDNMEYTVESLHE